MLRIVWLFETHLETFMLPHKFGNPSNSEYFCRAIRYLSFLTMTKKKKGKYKTGKKKLKPTEKDSIEELKNKIKHQKDALNKIIKNIQNNEEKTKD